MTAPECLVAPDELAPRYERGEDVEPLLRALLAGLAGAGAALAVDRVVPTPGVAGLLWARCLGGLVGAGSAPDILGLLGVLLLGVTVALVFVYGNVRRFVPGHPMLAGLVWAWLLWLLAAPALLARAGAWLGPAEAADGLLLLARAASVVAEASLGVALYGLVLGYVNPARGS